MTRRAAASQTLPMITSGTGTVCLTEPHAPYHIGEKERDQWLMCMDLALERIGASEELKTMLKEPLFRVADAVRNDAIDRPSVENPNIIARG